MNEERKCQNVCKCMYTHVFQESVTSRLAAVVCTRSGKCLFNHPEHYVHVIACCVWHVVPTIIYVFAHQPLATGNQQRHKCNKSYPYPKLTTRNKPIVIIIAEKAHLPPLLSLKNFCASCRHQTTHVTSICFQLIA